MKISTFIKQHPSITYFVLTFAISWGVVFFSVGGFNGLPGTTEQFQTLLPYVVLAMLLGPSVSGILMTMLLYGKKGIRNLLSRLFTWKVKIRWYAVALFTAPILTVAALLALSLIPGIFSADNKITHLILGVITGLAAGCFEELGWTGFVIPQLRQRYSIFTTGIIVGLLWGAWHFIVTLWGSSATIGTLSLGLYLPGLLFSFLPPYRILMVWVYDRTQSLLIAMLMHASLTASVRIFDPLVISGMPLLIYNIVLGIAFWAVVTIAAYKGNIFLPNQKLKRD